MIEYPTYDDQLNELTMRANNGSCDGPLDQKIARELLGAFMELRRRNRRLVKQSRGRRRAIKSLQLHVRNLDGFLAASRPRLGPYQVRPEFGPEDDD